MRNSWTESSFLSQVNGVYLETAWVSLLSLFGERTPLTQSLAEEKNIKMYLTELESLQQNATLSFPAATASHISVVFVAAFAAVQIWVFIFLLFAIVDLYNQNRISITSLCSLIVYYIFFSLFLMAAL